MFRFFVPLFLETAMAFRVIQGALSVIVTQIRTLASLASEVDRIHFLLVCMESMADQAGDRAKTSSDDQSATTSALDDGYVAVPLSDKAGRGTSSRSTIIPATARKDSGGGGGDGSSDGEEAVLLSVAEVAGSDDDGYGLGDGAGGGGGETRGGVGTDERITTVAVEPGDPRPEGETGVMIKM